MTRGVAGIGYGYDIAVLRGGVGVVKVVHSREAQQEIG